MKATGVVRRIDDLGRVVIPKEIRRTLRIREGDSLEIFVNNLGDVIFKKYSPIADLSEFATAYSDAIYNTTRKDIIIIDREKVVASSGKIKSKVANKKVSNFTEKMIENRMNKVEKDYTQLEICEGVVEDSPYAFSTIVSSGDPVGAVLILQGESSTEKINETDLNLAKTAATFLGKYLEG